MRWYSKSLALGLCLLIGAASAQTLGPPGSGGAGITALTGDCTASGSGSVATNCTKTGGVAFGPLATVPAATFITGTGSQSVGGTGTPVNIATAALTVGTWLCYGSIAWTITNNASDLRGWISITSATDPGGPNSGAYYDQGTLSTGILYGAGSWPVGTIRLVVATTATAFLTAKQTASGGANTAAGFIGCIPTT
jgi:hypothetical protein